MDSLRSLLDSHRIALAVVFGSRARGDARPDSDLDLGVLHRDERPLSYRELSELALALEDWRHGATAIPTPLGAGTIDLADLSSPDALFRFQIAKDALVLHADTHARWVEWLTRTLIDYDELAYHLPMLIAGVERAAKAGQP